MAEVYASMGIACVVLDGMDMPVKSGMRNLGLSLHLPKKEHKGQRATQLEKKSRQVSHRSSQLEVEERPHKQLLQRLHRQSTSVPHVEKAALALDMVNAILQKQSVTVSQAGMEFSVTLNIVKAGTAHWDQIALATGFATQELVNVPQVGVKTLTQRTRLLQMCARTKFAPLVVGIMANV